MNEFTRMISRIAMPIRCAIAALLVIALPPLASAQGQPVLREQIKVYSDLVTLGDIFENAGLAQNAPVFRAPDLGTHGVVAAKRIATAASQHGLIWDNPGAVEKVTVERPSRRITLKEIQETIAVTPRP